MAGTSNRGSTTGPFIVGAPTGTFNDQLVYLNTNELIPIVEMRVGNELKRLLTEYRLKSDCQCYPWADTWPYSGGIAEVSQNRGRFPTEPVPEPWGNEPFRPCPSGSATTIGTISSGIACPGRPVRTPSAAAPAA